ncbi:MAG: DUF3363 domain-containing protein [Hyphomonas sp.]|uniref:DUF3363 domain-containing protein n=1 Tax=Hyphomonas sp. TaxID=87 RepID=UPI0034A0AE62
MRLGGKGLALQRAHLGYLQREGAGHEGARAEFYDGTSEGVDGKDWLAKGAGDRHHFRFIVSAEDGERLVDLKPFIRSLVKDMEADLGTRLDWIAVDHHNTDHPHSHVLVRGVRDDGRDLVIDRDYVSSGIRYRAGQILTRELGLETQEEIELKISRAIPARRVTSLDRQMLRHSAANGVIDLGDVQRRGMHYRARLQVLERMGLAERAGAGRWQLSPDLLGSLSRIEQTDIAQARIREHLHDAGPGRAEGYRIERQSGRREVAGRVFAFGLADEQSSSRFVLIDGLDGRVHYVAISASGEVTRGAIVRVGPERLHMLSREPLDGMIKAEGRTLLDTWLAGQEQFDVSLGGFGADLRAAGSARLAELQRRGLIQSHERLDARLLTKLDWHAMHAEGARLSSEMGMAYRPARPGENLDGYFERDLSTKAGRFALIERSQEFSLVPWKPEFEQRRYTQIRMTVGRELTISKLRQRSLGLDR